MYRPRSYTPNFTRGILWLVLSFLLLSGVSYAVTADDCYDCHDNAVDERYPRHDSCLTHSVHADLECTDCHVEVKELPHPEEMARVNCGNCHDDVANEYKSHGLLKADGTGKGDVPVCSDCHGKHDILRVDDRDSRVSAVNMPGTCAKCHENLAITDKHELLNNAAVPAYQNSVHGRASLGGAYSAATCNDCHAMGGTAHNILDPSDPKSPVNHFNIPSTCGQCHKGIEQDYWEGIHGIEAKRGRADAPVCTNCHGEHGIIEPSDPDSRVSKMRLAEATCAPCHESASLNEKFDLKGERRTSWIDSYHGLKTQAGDVTVANCAACHGVHRILPQSNPASSVNPANLVETCGHCHANITKEMATTTIHGVPGEEQTPMAGQLANIYVYMIIVVIGGMLLYCLVDLRKQVKSVVIKKQVIRMFPGELAQHYLLMISFIVLVITGFALRFSDAFWVHWLFGFEGGFPLRGIIHRIAAGVLVITAFWHAFYLITQRGRAFLLDMLPKFSDISEFIGMVRYNLGMAKDRPMFGRFSYVEKMEYWALVWGTIIMALSGLSMWFENSLEQWLPKSYFDIMLVFHYYEAWLATLAIVVWHMYSTVFSPAVYPMNPSWIHGRMSGAMYHHEHPGATPRKEWLVNPQDSGHDDSQGSDSKGH